METKVEYKTSNINEWFKAHCLTQEQLAKLIVEKAERAENYLLAHRQVGKHFVCD